MESGERRKPLLFNVPCPCPRAIVTTGDSRSCLSGLPGLPRAPACALGAARGLRVCARVPAAAAPFSWSASVRAR